MAYVIANGIRIYYESCGSGHPLLLVPGAGYGGWFWHRAVPGLSQHYQIIQPDPRGCGESDKPDGPYSVQMLADDLIAFLDRLHIRGAYVAGHALGGQVTMQLALQRPELASKLVLAATNFGGSGIVPITLEAHEALTAREAEAQELVRRRVEVSCAEGFEERSPEIFEALVEYHLSEAVPSAAYHAQQAATIAMASPEASLEARLPSIEAPVLVLFGDQDKIVPPGNAELLSARLPQAHTVILPDTGHLFPLENPEATVGALVDFLGAMRYAGG